MKTKDTRQVSSFNNSKQNQTTRCILQKTETGKENMVGPASSKKRIKMSSESDESVGCSHPEKRIKLSSVSDNSVHPEETMNLSPETKVEVNFLEKAVQADSSVAADLPPYDPIKDYWKNLAEKLAEDLDSSFMEKEKLKSDIEVLEEEKEICKSMLAEAEVMVGLLKDINKDEAEEAVEDEN